MLLLYKTYVLACWTGLGTCHSLFLLFINSQTSFNLLPRGQTLLAFSYLTKISKSKVFKIA